MRRNTGVPCCWDVGVLVRREDNPPEDERRRQLPLFDRVRVLTTSHRKPPLRRLRQGLPPRIAEVRADFAVLPG
jgi:hypothetical protein